MHQNCTTWLVQFGVLYQWCRNLGLSFMDTTGWHQLGTVTTINTLQYGTNNMLRNNKHFENEHKVARANQAGFFCVSLCSPAAAVAFNRAEALLVVCFVGPSMTKCVFSYHPLLLLLCLDGTDFALILVFCFCSRVCVYDFVFCVFSCFFCVYVLYFDLLVCLLFLFSLCLSRCRTAWSNIAL